MLKYEKKLIEFLEKHYIVLSYIFITIVALLLDILWEILNQGIINIV